MKTPSLKYDTPVFTRQQLVHTVTKHTDFTKALFISKCHTVSRQTRKCHFIYNRKKSTTFTPPVFTKLVYVEQQYAQIS